MDTIKALPTTCGLPSVLLRGGATVAVPPQNVQ